MVFENGTPEVELGDVPLAKPPRGRRWTVGRVTTALAIILIAVPLGLNILEPQVRGPGSCGSTTDNFALGLGLFLLAVRPTWFFLKTLNNAGERALAALTGRDDFAAIPPTSHPKPKPLDDL